MGSAKLLHTSCANTTRWPSSESPLGSPTAARASAAVRESPNTMLLWIPVQVLCLYVSSKRSTVQA